MRGLRIVRYEYFQGVQDQIEHIDQLKRGLTMYFEPTHSGDIKDILPKTGLNKAFRQPSACQVRMAVDGFPCE